MNNKESLHSICRWTFHSGKGGFTPGNIRPSWSSKDLNSAGFVRLVKEKISPRIPSYIKLGVEFHYDNEICEKTASEVSAAMTESGINLAMITPGAHGHFAYGGVCSLDKNERKAAEELGARTVDLAYGPLKKNWHSSPDKAPSFVIWNGSYGYDLATTAVREMYSNLKKSLAALCEYEAKKGGQLYFGIEPKPNEGHPTMILPTVASVIVLWNKINKEFGINLDKKGLNMEIGHSEMIGLDPLHDMVEQIDNNMLFHIHPNSQGYNDGITLGGPGKYDIDHGVKITGMNIALAGLLIDAKYSRWHGHDMQPRAYDNEQQSIDRVVRSIISWEACSHAASQLDKKRLMTALEQRETAVAEDIMRNSLVTAQQWFNENYSR